MNQLKLILMLVTVLLLTTQNTHARHAEILIDADNGTILHELEASQSWYPASLTKLMTLYMAFDALKAGQIQLDDRIIASSHAARQPNSRLGLRTGDNLSVEDAILALITRSANDAAVALGEHLGGTEENFAVKMTAKAHAIGMSDSYFMNATGLPNDLQVSTAHDLGLLAWRTLRDFPDYYPYFSVPNLYFKGRQLPAINKFTKTYPGAEGMKTGFTCGSGYNLISSASQNGKRLMGVVLGGMSSPQRYQLMIAMMNNGFANQYTAGRSITAPEAMSSTSTPPYQLGCGRHVATTVAVNDDDVSSDAIGDSASNYHHASYHAPRYYRHSSHRFASHRPVAVHRHFVRAVASKTRHVAATTAKKTADRTRYHRLSHGKHR